MFRARERGMSFWPFAVSLLALIAFVIMWFSASSERDDAKRSAERASGDRKAMEDERNAAIAKLVAVSKVVGFTAGGNSTDPAEVERQLTEYRPKLRDALTITFPTSRFQAAEGGGTVSKADGGSVTVVYLSDAEASQVVTAQDFLSKFETAAHRMKFDIERSFAGTEQARNEKDAVVKSDQETIAAKDKRIADLTGETAALDNQMREKETELKDQIAQLTSQKDAKDTELETMRKQSEANEKKLLSAVNEAQGQVRSLVQRDAPLLSEGPDGEVIVADNGVAIVNRGKAQWLMPGTMFDVWGLAKGGAKYKKGTIKITSCDDETARGAIVEEVSRDPITKGDLIQSLTYSPNRQLHFVLVGDMKKMGRSQAEAVLTKLGAKVDPTVSASTNYLVVGEFGAGQNMDDNPAVKAAKDLGIRMITEEQLASFARY